MRNPFFSSFIFSTFDTFVFSSNPPSGESTIAKVTTTPQVHTTRQSIPGKPDPCDSTLDAMVMTADETTYAFKGAYFWPVGDYGVFTEALKISEFWEGLEGDIDAAYTRQYDGLTFIFKGSK